MNVLFWNLGSKCNNSIVADIIAEKDIDIAVFSEYTNTNFESVVKLLGNKYSIHVGYSPNEKIILLARNSIYVDVRREQTRYILYSFTENNILYILAGIHLPSNPNSSAEDRKNVSRDIVRDVKELEKELKTNNTIIIGDFNASPFDSELTQKDTFNAVLYKDLILKKEYVRSNGKIYRRFYNPTVNYISENSSNYGSFYYSAGIDSLYWFCYDQILVRKPLVNSITNLDYCRRIKTRSLIKTSAPDKTISDHLPLIVTLKGGA